MLYAIEVLEKEREKIIEDLKAGKKERQKDLKEIDRAVGWLKGLQGKEVEDVCKYEMLELPPVVDCGGFASYRIVSDGEGEEQPLWKELKKEDETELLLYAGDLVLAKK